MLIALTFAAANGNLRSVALLLDAGADIEHRDERSFTPLMAAAFGGYSEVVNHLLLHGANPDAVGRGGVTARSLAEERRFSDVVNTLDQWKRTSAASPAKPGEAPGPP